MIQLDFLKNEENQNFEAQLQTIKTTTEKVRKSLFAKHGELTKKYLDLLYRMEIL